MADTPLSEMDLIAMKGTKSFHATHSLTFWTESQVFGAEDIADDPVSTSIESQPAVHDWLGDYFKPSFDTTGFTRDASDSQQQQQRSYSWR